MTPLLASAAASSTSNSNSIFLIPNGTILFELVIFIVVLGIMAKFVLPPIQRVMDERERAIQSGLSQSDAGRLESERLESERRETLEAARTSARSVLEEAGRSVAELVEQARGRGQAEYERVVGVADARLSAERARLREEAFSEAGALVVEAAEQVIGDEIDPERHRAEIARVIEERSRP